MHCVCAHRRHVSLLCLCRKSHSGLYALGHHLCESSPHSYVSLILTLSPTEADEREKERIILGCLSSIIAEEGRLLLGPLYLKEGGGYWADKYRARLKGVSAGRVVSSKDTKGQTIRHKNVQIESRNSILQEKIKKATSYN